MNMMTVQSEREEHSVPASVSDYDTHSSEQSAYTPRGFASGLAWFRNQRLASKVNTIFAAFTVFGTAMLIVLGFGMSEVWNRYHTSDAIERAMSETSEFRATFSDVRYTSVRFLSEQDTALLARRRDAVSMAQGQLADVKAVMAERAPQFAPRVEQLERDLTAYNTAFDRTLAEFQQNPRSDRAATQD